MYDIIDFEYSNHCTQSRSYVVRHTQCQYVPAPNRPLHHVRIPTAESTNYYLHFIETLHVDSRHHNIQSLFFFRQSWRNNSSPLQAPRAWDSWRGFISNTAMISLVVFWWERYVLARWRIILVIIPTKDILSWGYMRNGGVCCQRNWHWKPAVT